MNPIHSEDQQGQSNRVQRLSAAPIKALRPILRLLTDIRFWGYGLFWSWNIIFLVFMALGFAPTVLPDTIRAVGEETIPLIFLVYAVILMLIPLLAVIVGFTLLRHAPGKLLALGYGVEGPLMVMLILRFFVVRDINPAISMLMIVGSLALLALLWQILDARPAQRPLALSYLRLVGLTLTLFVGIYAGVAVAFFVIPLALGLPEIVRSLLWGLRDTLRTFEWRDIFVLISSLLGGVLSLYTATLVIAMPIAVPAIYIGQWRRSLQIAATRQTWLRPMLLSLGVITVVIVWFIQANRQPQHDAYALLANPPVSTEQASLLHQKEDALRTGLLNAYLSPLRYIGVVGESGLIHELYFWSLKLSDEKASQVEHLYEIWVRPLLYEPIGSQRTAQNEPPADAPKPRPSAQALEQDPQKAAHLYEAYFDLPIFEGERETILTAVQATWSAEQALSGWQAVDDREVLLTQQAISITEHSDWAEVELYEVYVNQTFEPQEVVYYFSLPESAVITGIWLSNKPDRALRSAYQVAPRGAAQALYHDEISIRIDPALIEQIGPFQYRLRIYPVEARLWSRNTTETANMAEYERQLHFWMTYRVLAQENAWPMPTLAEKVNVYWDDSTLRRVNGQAVTGAEQAWLPTNIPASTAPSTAAHRVDFPSGETVIIRPLSPEDKAKFTAHLHDGVTRRFAVVIDRSASMAGSASELQAALGILAAYPANIDAYLTSSIYRGEGPLRVNLAGLDDQALTFRGGQNGSELLEQFYQLYDGTAYDAIFVLTDGSAFRLGSAMTSNADFSAFTPLNIPIWVVHVDGRFPYGYDDDTLQLIQSSRGGMTGSIEAALERLAINLSDHASTADSSVVWIDGYEWVTLPDARQVEASTETISHTPEEPFAAFAARRLIMDNLYRQRGQLQQISTLDNLHAIAVAQGIVTPYSSMIVLVNSRQRQSLEELSQQSDRFQREAEAMGETPSANPFQVTGVPEPHEWLLLGLAALMLGWYTLRRR